MGRFVVNVDDYSSVTYELDNGEEITISIQETCNSMEHWTPDRLAREYKRAYKKHQPRKMVKIREQLHHYGEDIYVHNGKVYWLTYNGCEKKL